MRPLARAALLAALAALLAACAPLVPAPAPAPAPAPHTWVVGDSAALLAALPPLPAGLPEPPPAPADPAALAPWREPASAWVRAGLAAIVDERTAPPLAARSLMLLTVAMSDALAVAGAAGERGVEVSADAAVAEAAGRVLAFTHPSAAPPAGAAEAAVWAGLWRGEAGVAGVINGRHLGAAVADAVIAWATADGATAALPSPAPLAGPGRWQPTPPLLEPAQLPGWGQVRTVALAGPDQAAVPPPPAWGSSAMDGEVAAFTTAQAQLTDEQRLAAAHWSAGPGTVTPPGMWMETALGLAAREGLGLEAAARLYAVLGVALHDTAVACWAAKYRHWVVRPVQVMQERTPGWLPLLRTPPHPAYPSRHAAFSGAAAAVLGAFFPADAVALDQQAAEAARSRVYGGIHWPMDGAAGLRQGRQAAALVLERSAP